jgi:hypothetical protein
MPETRKGHMRTKQLLLKTVRDICYTRSLHSIFLFLLLLCLQKVSSVIERLNTQRCSVVHYDNMHMLIYNWPIYIDTIFLESKPRQKQEAAARAWTLEMGWVHRYWEVHSCPKNKTKPWILERWWKKQWIPRGRHQCNNITASINSITASPSIHRQQALASPRPKQSPVIPHQI